MKLFDYFRARYLIKKKFINHLGYSADLKNPQSYCEKIQWLKLNRYSSDKTVIQNADKYTVREFIREKGFGQHLVTLLGHWDRPEDIDWDLLPSHFVLKRNNASGPNFCWFVKDKSTFSIDKFEIECKRRMLKKPGYRKGEFHYSKMPNKIIAEAFLEEEDHKPIRDYKFYCFHGKVAFLSVEEEKMTDKHVREYYTTDWQKHSVAFLNDVPSPKTPFSKPRNFLKMLNMAHILSEDYPHVRVDLYNINGKIYFGELTYTPQSGFTQWGTKALDFEYGKLMNIHSSSTA